MNVNRVVLTVLVLCGLSTSSEGLEVQVFWRGNSLAGLAGGGSATGEVPAGSSVSTTPVQPQAVVDNGTFTSGTNAFTITANGGYMSFLFSMNNQINLPNFTIRTTTVTSSTSFSLMLADPTSGTVMANVAGLSAGYNNIVFSTPVTLASGDQTIFLVNNSAQPLSFTVPTNFTPVFVVPEPSAIALGLVALLCVGGTCRRKTIKKTTNLMK